MAARVAAELAAEPARRGVVIAWSAGAAGVAAVFLAAFAFLGGFAEAEAPTYQLVHVEQTRPDVQFFRPVRMSDGSFARPVRVRWEDTTRWEDARTRTHLIDYRPNDRLTLLPLETH